MALSRLIVALSATAALLSGCSDGDALAEADERACDAGYMLVEDGGGFDEAAVAIDELDTSAVERDPIRQAANRAKLITGDYLAAEPNTPAYGQAAEALLFTVGELIDACAAVP